MGSSGVELSTLLPEPSTVEPLAVEASVAGPAAGEPSVAKASVGEPGGGGSESVSQIRNVTRTVRRLVTVQVMVVCVME